MTAPRIEQKAREVRELLPPYDLTRPGPRPMSPAEAMEKVAAGYADALALLGKI